MSETQHNAVVYVVTRGEAYENATIDGVFDNIDAARACARHLMESSAIVGQMWLPEPTSINIWQRGGDYLEITAWLVHRTLAEYEKNLTSTE